MPHPVHGKGAQPPLRAPAPHVQAAMGRTAQARMAQPAFLPSRPPAPHVQAALRGAAQPKAAPGGAARPTPAAHVQAALRGTAPPKPAPAPPPRPAAHAGRGSVQRMLSFFSKKPPEPDNKTGEDRSTESVTTAGGVWTAVRYVAVERYNGADAWGASMHLDFTPLHPTDATQISLVQTVLPFKNGQFYFTDKTTENRAYAGSAIDQAPDSRSPLYADEPGTGGGLLGSSTEQEGMGRHGYRFQDIQTGKWKFESARLKDLPHFRGVTGFSSQTFETTALAVDGNDRGTYYGSVRWGWRSNGRKGHVKLDPLSVVSKGSTSSAFKLSLKQWNETKTSQGATPQQLPRVGNG